MDKEGQRTSEGDLKPERAEKPRELGTIAEVPLRLTRPLAGLLVEGGEKR
jgi:hypothetical protein